MCRFIIDYKYTQLYIERDGLNANQKTVKLMTETSTLD